MYGAVNTHAQRTDQQRSNRCLVRLHLHGYLAAAEIILQDSPVSIHAPWNQRQKARRRCPGHRAIFVDFRISYGSLCNMLSTRLWIGLVRQDIGRYWRVPSNLGSLVGKVGVCLLPHVAAVLKLTARRSQTKPSSSLPSFGHGQWRIVLHFYFVTTRGIHTNSHYRKLTRHNHNGLSPRKVLLCGMGPSLRFDDGPLRHNATHDVGTDQTS